jgi:hypothetical protein
MIKKFIAAAILTTTVSIASTSAQLLSVKDKNNTETLNGNTTNQAIYTDSENKVLFIDFAKIDVNLSEISVRNSDNSIVYKDENVWKLPVDFIFDLDFSTYPKGDYIVELKSFTGIVRKKISLK